VSLSCQKMGKAEPEITEAALAELKQYQWSGNIRELNNAVERLIILGGSTIDADSVKKFARPLIN
ncbi:MAG: sigma-54-dependent Fis family transcriptional regulator, partial [Bacteroidales bacterium]|nr:sigma-54-dependent Fis family transcriptional regulator [Bacteroidales bacterium]